MAVGFGGADYFTPGFVMPTFVSGCYAFWIKTTQTTSNVCPFSNANGSSNNGASVILNNVAGKLLGYVRDTAGGILTVYSTTSVNDGAWHHMAFNFQTAGGLGEIFIDGVSEATGTHARAWSFNGNTPRIGKSFDGFWGGFVGSLAEIGVWTVNLTAPEVSSLAKGFSPRHIRPASLLSYAPLIANGNDRKGSPPSVSGSPTVGDHVRMFGSA